MADVYTSDVGREVVLVGSGNRFAQRGNERYRMTSGRMCGFSLIEMMTVATIILIVTGIVVAGLQPAIKYSHVNNGYNTTLAAIRQ